jgi:predicted porin
LPWDPRFPLGCAIGTPLAHSQFRLHPTPGGVWRLREKLRSGAATGVAAFDVYDKELETEGVFMNTRTKLAIAVSTAMLIVPMTRAIAGIDVAAGDWKIDFSGNVNGFYTGASCQTPSTTTGVTGGFACAGDNSASIRNGLLPAALVFTATTRQDNFDIGVTIGFYPGINSSAAGQVNLGGGSPNALGTPGIDARQTFFTFGDASWGTVKIGRDIGLFAKDAILDDMTLLGMGTASGNAAPSNTSLGRIGLGYIYTDWEPQITYTSANYNGFVVSAGIFQPLNEFNQDNALDYSKHTSPQFQAGLGYTFGDPKNGPVSGKVWFDVVTQQYQLPTIDQVPGIASSNTGTAFDGGVKIDVAGFEGVLYGYSGKGVGTTGLYLDGVSPGGSTRKSDGGYAQATYKFDKLKVGLSYGISDLKLANDEVSTDNALLKRNASGVVGLYYSLTKSVTLVGEYIDTKSTAQGGNEAREHDYALGGILFF